MILDLRDRGGRQKAMTIVQSWGLGGSVSFPGSKQDYINDGYAGSSTVYSIVSIISETFASAPLVLYKVKSKKALERYKLLSKNPAANLDLLRAKNAAMDEVEEHPILTLLNTPNPLQGGFDFRVHANASRDITGDTFLYVNRGLSGRGEPLQLFILPSQYMNLKTSNPYSVEGYQLNIGKPTDFTPDECLHWRYTNLDYDTAGQHLFGQSPLKAACNDYTLSASKEGKKAAANAFKNQGAGGLLSRADEYPWGTDQRDSLNEYLEEVVNGNANRGKIRALNSKVNWVQMAMSASDMKLIEGLGVTKEELCNIYNFPPHLLTASAGTFSNVDAANKYLVTKTTYSRWISFRDFVNAKLLPMYKDGAQYYFDFDISAFPEVQDDQAKLVTSLEKMPITLNEFRSMLGWDEIKDPNMDKIYIPSGKVPLDQANAELGGSIDDDVNELNRQGVKDYS